MNKTQKLATVATAVIAAAGLLMWPGIASAQQDKTRTVEQYTCKDVMRESGADRDVAIAFLHGFILGKSGSSRFDIDQLRKQSNSFIERCLDNTGERALDVMTKVKT